MFWPMCGSFPLHRHWIESRLDRGIAPTMPEVDRVTTDDVSRYWARRTVHRLRYVVPPRQSTGAAVTQFIVLQPPPPPPPSTNTDTDDGWSRLTDDQAPPPRVGHATGLDVRFLCSDILDKCEKDECPPSWPERMRRRAECGKTSCRQCLVDGITVTLITKKTAGSLPVVVVRVSQSSVTPSCDVTLPTTDVVANLHSINKPLTVPITLVFNFNINYCTAAVLFKDTHVHVHVLYHCIFKTVWTIHNFL